jgi:hypothetical protein
VRNGIHEDSRDWKAESGRYHAHPGFHQPIREISRFVVRIQRRWGSAGGFEEMVTTPLGN